jgi:DNA modification methylase
MFSFYGDLVLDPFLGTGTTAVAAAKVGRNTIGYDVENHYLDMAERRIEQLYPQLSPVVERIIRTKGNPPENRDDATSK